MSEAAPVRLCCGQRHFGALCDAEESPLPNPGSREAVAAGCRCPIMDNHHGRGREGWWYVSELCPLHAPDGAL